ncbi:DUF6708 domain-containing protein [Luteimonas suaedae]|uniref:DUF6708 domain-containing protein n=1 Tax=Luteimonas suaedae TaxID=2605430 RepID=UPI0011EC0CEA|nr:DUF6708 domain-containing protein [Luteimonas suaedae]
MDFTGQGRFTAYKVDRPLTEQERADRLDRKRKLNTQVRDELSVIKINSTYMELVDRWYAPKGWSVIFAMMVASPFLYAAPTFTLIAIGHNNLESWAFLAFVLSFCFLFFWIAWYGFRLEAFRQTHYPIRLNRKKRKVHAYRPDGRIIEADWDKLYFCVGESIIPAYGKTYDVRAHVMGKDRKTVVDTFTLAYCYMGKKDKVRALWEYIRRYMEEPDGVEQNWRYSDICMPIDGRREGFWFGIVRVFAQGSEKPILLLFLSPVWSVVTLGRWIAMYTSKVPKWPAEIEAQYVIEPDDPCRRDWRNNVKFNFQEGVWPVICFVVGLSVVVWGLSALMSAMD